MIRVFLSGIVFIFLVPIMISAQAPIPVADQTFRMEGEHEFVYAFARGDELTLHIQLLVGRQVKTVEFVQHLSLIHIWMQDGGKTLQGGWAEKKSIPLHIKIFGLPSLPQPV